MSRGELVLSTLDRPRTSAEIAEQVQFSVQWVRRALQGLRATGEVERQAEWYGPFRYTFVYRRTAAAASW